MNMIFCKAVLNLTSTWLLQWRTLLTPTSWSWGTCWCARTCKTWRMWLGKRITRITALCASRIWPAWWSGRGNAGQRMNRHQMITSDYILQCKWTVCLFMSLRFITELPVWFMLLFISSSLCNRLRDSASDLPMPLMPVDSETERLILEKDEEVIQFCFLSH